MYTLISQLRCLLLAPIRKERTLELLIFRLFLLYLYEKSKAQVYTKYITLATPRATLSQYKTNSNIYNPLVWLIGATGFEPAT